MLENRRVDPRIIRTKSLILQAFNELCGEKAFKKITVKNITDRAMINRATFYAHFDDKHHLLNFSVSESFKENLEMLLPNAEKSAFNEENFYLMSKATMMYMEMFFNDFQPALSASNEVAPVLQAKIQQILADITQNWLQTAPSLSPCTREIIIQMISLTIFGTSLSYGRMKEDMDIEHISRTMAIILWKSADLWIDPD